MKKNIQALTVPAVLILLVLLNVNLSSCTKTDTKTVTIQDTTTVTIHDTTVVKDTLAPAPSVLSLLTGKQWELDSVYSGYTGPGTGALIYARGGSGNLEDLDNYYTTFTIDGYLWQAANTTYYSATWSFINSDSTTYKLVSTGYGTDYGRIIKLGASNLTLYDSTNSTLDIEILKP